ncbi:MATE family efflux transporter [Streptomyces sp. cg40]|uniref:MATE family efflux transporter n=1 Tax=Streptomyces sp. cg40 TaxID=3419764 RepID=UPI003CFF7587
MNSHRKQLISLAHPVYLSLLASVAAGIINTVWVARLGGPAVAAVAVATGTENVLLGIALVFASGTTVLVAHARGARDPAALRSAVRGGWALCALVTPAVVASGFLLRAPLSRLLLGGTGPELPLAVAYFTISLPGIAVFYVQQLVDGILKGTGDTRTPMRLALLANGLILVCDPFLIHLYGVRGAAASTVLCRVLALGVGLRALRRNALLRTTTVPAECTPPGPASEGAASVESAPAGPVSDRSAVDGPGPEVSVMARPAPAEAVSGESAAVGRGSSEVVLGRPASTGSVSGRSVSGRPVSGRPVSGRSAPVECASAEAVSGESVAVGPGSPEVVLARPVSTGSASAPPAPTRPAPGEPAPADPLSVALRRTFTTGLPMAADFTVRQGGALVLVAIVARLGVSAVAAYAIGYKVLYVATMAFYSVRQAASIHTAHLRGTGEDARREIGREAMFVSGAVGVVAAVLLCVTAPWIMAAFGTGPQVAHQGALFLRCVGPYLLLMACFIALGGVFEGSGGAPALLRVTVLGTAVQLPLAYGLSGLGLPGVCLAMALSMGVQCGVVAVLFRRGGARSADRSAGEGRRPVEADEWGAVRAAVRRGSA